MIDCKNMRQPVRVAPTVSRLVEPEADRIPAKIYDVKDSRAINVGQSKAMVIAILGVIEMGWMIHGHLGPERP